MSKIVKDASQRIDVAIAKAEPFAQKILIKLRTAILATDGRLVEDWKWGPCFHLNGNVVGIWGHKKHVNMIFWKGAAMLDPDNLFIDANSDKALRTIQYFDVKDVKVTQVKRYVKNAIKVVESGQVVKAKKQAIIMPDIFKEALKADNKLGKYYDALSYYHQKEFAHYIGEAKRESTIEKRLIKVLDMIERKVGLHDAYK